MSKWLPRRDHCWTLWPRVLPALCTNKQRLIFSVAISSNSNQPGLYFGRCICKFSIKDTVSKKHELTGQDIDQGVRGSWEKKRKREKGADNLRTRGAYDHMYVLLYSMPRGRMYHHIHEGWPESLQPGTVKKERHFSLDFLSGQPLCVRGREIGR